MHSPDCRGPYLDTDTNCYCGESWLLYCERVVGDVMYQLGESWSWRGKVTDVQQLMLVVSAHVEWKKFAVTLLCAATDTEEHDWRDQLPPSEILERPDVLASLVERVLGAGGGS